MYSAQWCDCKIPSRSSRPYKKRVWRRQYWCVTVWPWAHHQVNVPEKPENTISFWSGDSVASFRERKRKPTISFMSVEFHTHFLFIKEWQMNQLASWSWKWSAMHNIDLSRYFLRNETSLLHCSYTIPLFGMYCICFLKENKYTQGEGKETAWQYWEWIHNKSIALWPWDELPALCIAGPQENEGKIITIKENKGMKCPEERKRESEGSNVNAFVYVCLFVCLCGVGAGRVLRGLSGTPHGGKKISTHLN